MSSLGPGFYKPGPKLDVVRAKSAEWMIEAVTQITCEVCDVIFPPYLCMVDLPYLVSSSPGLLYIDKDFNLNLHVIKNPRAYGTLGSRTSKYRRRLRCRLEAVGVLVAYWSVYWCD